MAIEHELSWSTSRAGTLEACARRYYHDYYLSWLGWNASAEPLRRQAYLLKKMTRMPMLAGDLVHQAVQRWFESRRQDPQRPRDLEQDARRAVEWAAEELREGYRTSRSGRWKMRPSKLVHLAEHHYQEPRIEESDGSAATYGKRYVDRIRTCLEGFFAMPELERVRCAHPDTWLACEDLSTFELLGTKVYAVPDFALRDEQGVVHIYDWKTGAPREQDAFQLAVYAHYAQAHWGADPDRTRSYDVYLGERRVVEVAPGDPRELLARVEASMGAMRALHFDADRGTGDPQAFPMVAGAPRAEACGTCNYRELCAAP